MTINYSKISLFLITFLIWNIASPFFIKYQTNYSGYEKGSEFYIYPALWIIWLFVSLLIEVKIYKHSK